MRKKLLVGSMLCALMLGAAGMAGASPIFSENFDAENGGNGALNYTGFKNWTVDPRLGTVDLIGNDFFDFMAGTGHGLYVDLDGSTNKAGAMFSNFINIPTKGDYVLSFQLAGSHNGTEESVTRLLLGSGIDTKIITVAADQYWKTYTAYFTTTGSEDVQIQFQNAGGDNIGALLDDVSVSAVPEPGTMLLLGSGFLGLAIFGKRRKNA